MNLYAFVDVLSISMQPALLLSPESDCISPDKERKGHVLRDRTVFVVYQEQETKDFLNTTSVKATALI